MEKFSVKQALLDLLYVDVHLPKVAKDFPEYQTLINFIVTHRSLDDDDVPYPTIKEAAEATNIRYDKIRKQIQKLYELMFPFMEHKYLKFTKVKYELSFSYFKNYHFMVLDQFPVHLRIGENITMPFLRAKLQTDRFHITSIRHNFERDTQIIEIELEGGDYNLFWHIRKDEAMEKREIPFMHFYEKDDYSLREEIIRGLDIKKPSYGGDGFSGGKKRWY